jgi:hypothetical protein
MYYKMPQNYAEFRFMNSDYKEVTCVCDTVHHVRLETSQLLADRFCLCLQTEGKGQSNMVGHLDRGFVCRRSKYKGYLCPKDPPLSVLTATFHLKKERDISLKRCVSFTIAYCQQYQLLRNVKFLSVLLLYHVEY